MLQIVTGMYYRDGVERHETVQRQVLYTNCSLLRHPAIELPVGRILPSVGHSSVSAVTVEVTEQLEAKLPDGSDSVLIATSGLDLIDDLALVLSFGLNATFSRNFDLVTRVVHKTNDEIAPTGSIFRRTFDPALYISDDDLSELEGFMRRLLALRRPHYERAMRAMRRFVRETRTAGEAPTEAYAGMVAALESLTAGVEPPPQQWDRLDHRTRAILDPALAGLNDQDAERIREAVLEAERAGATQRFVTLLMDSVDVNFYRRDAVGATAPIRAADLERLVRQAYAIRSGNVHSLDEIPPEAWVHGSAETVSPPEVGLMLSLQGLARLGRATIRSYIDRAPVGVDPEFDWRSSLPGLLRFQWAAQYWLDRPGRYDASSAESTFSAFVEQVVSGEGISDMSAVVKKIETLLPQTAAGPKEKMIGLYALWNSLAPPDKRRPRAAAILAQHGSFLQAPSVLSFVVEVLSGSNPGWTPEQWATVAEDRRRARRRHRHLDLPAGLDAALCVHAAEAMAEAGRADAGRAFAAWAVEELPGCEPLIAWEAAFEAGESRLLDLPRDLFGLGTAADEIDGDETDET